jgi:hypothetical protein
VEGVPVPEPAPMEQVTRHARRIRVRRYVSGAVTAAVVVGAGIGVPAGLLTSLRGGPGGGPTVVGSAAATASLPDVAEIVCEGTSTQVLTPQVKPQPDGVHFRVDNRSGQDLALQFGQTDFFVGAGTNAFQGVHEIAFHDVPPGEVRVRCMDAEKDSGSDEGFVSLQVVDEDGIWVPDRLQCGGDGAVVGSGSYAEGAEGSKGDPVDIFKAAHADDIQDGDEVRLGGYPESENPKVMLIRDEQVVGLAVYTSDGKGGWLEGSFSECSPGGDRGTSGGGSSGSTGTG